MTMDEPRCSRLLLLRQPPVVPDECHFPEELLAYENSFSAKGAVIYLPALLTSTASKANALTEDFLKIIFLLNSFFIRTTMTLVNLCAIVCHCLQGRQLYPE